MLFCLKRIVKGKIFWICTVLMAVLLVAGCGEDLFMERALQPSVFYMYLISTGIGIVAVLMPVLASMPFLFYYTDEIKSGNAHFQMIRMKKKSRYLAGQFLAATGSAVLMAVIALAIFTVFCIFAGAGWQANDVMLQGFFQDSMYDAYLQKGTTVMPYMIYAFTYVLFSMEWGLIGMAVSFFIKNRYVVIAAPFLFAQIMGYLMYGAYAPYTTLLQTVHLHWAGGGLYYAIGYHIISLSIWIGLSVLFFYRRLRYEGV